MSQAPTEGLCGNNEPSGEKHVCGQDENVYTHRLGKGLPCIRLNEDEHLHGRLHCRTDPADLLAARTWQCYRFPQWPGSHRGIEGIQHFPNHQPQPNTCISQIWQIHKGNWKVYIRDALDSIDNKLDNDEDSVKKMSLVTILDSNAYLTCFESLKPASAWGTDDIFDW